MLKKYLPLVIWCIVIFGFSSIPNARINQDRFIDLIIRKTLHFSIYFVLYIVSYRALNKNPLKAVVFCALYALSDEGHQHFVEGRGPSLIDALIDTFGSIFGMIVVWKNKLLLAEKKII